MVFDGYKSPSVKDHEHHQRRSAVTTSRFVAIKDDAAVPYSMVRYLSFDNNKVEFIKFLSSHISSSGISVVNCDRDADCTIVQAAITNASKVGLPDVLYFKGLSFILRRRPLFFILSF